MLSMDQRDFREFTAVIPEGAAIIRDNVIESFNFSFLRLIGAQVDANVEGDDLRKFIKISDSGAQHNTATSRRSSGTSSRLQISHMSILYENSPATLILVKPSDEQTEGTNETLEKTVRLRTAELSKAERNLDKEHSKRKDAEHIAESERERLYRLTELLPVGMMLLSPDYRVLYENRFFRDRFGNQDSQYCYELIFGRNTSCDECAGRKILATGSFHYWEASDQKDRIYGLHGFPFEHEDGSPAILIIGIDITDRKQTEHQLNAAQKQIAARAEQLRALVIELSHTEERQRRSFAQVLHDELQQLLVAIKFSADYLLSRTSEGCFTSELRHMVELITQSINLTRSLTTELAPPVLYESSLVGSLQWLSRWMKEKHQLGVTIVAQENVPDLPEEYRVMIFQAVRELLFNVVKHANVNEARVTVAHEDGKALHISVEDEGNGFILSEKPDTTPGSFGLFSIRERLSALGGDMELRTQPAEGTRVDLHVPIKQQQKLPGKQVLARKPDVVPQETITEPGLARILVVDDHTVVREGLMEILERQPGMLVVGQAVDGQEAVERARALHPTTVLMDVNLPRMSGIDATRTITQEMPDVHVIALSMHARQDMETQMREAGATRYVLKDCPIGDLISAIYETENVRTQRII